MKKRANPLTYVFLAIVTIVCFFVLASPFVLQTR